MMNRTAMASAFMWFTVEDGKVTGSVWRDQGYGGGSHLQTQLPEQGAS